MSSSLRFSDTIIVTMWRTECHSFFGKFCNLFAYFCFFWNFLLSHSIFAEFTPAHDSCWPTCLGITLVFSCSHTHYSALAWVSCLLSCSHTHYSALAWVSCLLFLLHTHYSALAWVSCLLFLLSYPLLCSGLGITLTSPAPYPRWLACLGITLISPAPYPLLCSCLGILLISPAPYPRRPTKTNIQNKEKGMYAKIKHTYPVYKKVNSKLYSILFLSQLVSYI